MDVVSLPRRLVGVLVLVVCFWLIVRHFFLERFHIPTGSMAPTLMGDHRRIDCPRCKCPIRVGTHAGTDAFCPNCGKGPLSLARVPVSKGDHVLADKQSLSLYPPRRWALVLFELLGEIFIKRIIGLPGERVAVVDGDVTIDGELCRKTLEEAWRMRILVFDNDCQPKPHGWRQRWKRQPPTTSAADQLLGDCRELHLNGHTPNQCVWYAYWNFQLDENKCRPITDEYAYNGRPSADTVPVHDFMLTCDIETGSHDGWLCLAMNDGGDQVVLRLPIGRPASQPSGKSVVRPFPHHGRFRTLTTPAATCLHKNRRHQLLLGLVDRRLTCCIDGKNVVQPFDFPAQQNREPVSHPFAVGVANTKLTVRHIRLFRDVHYTNEGRNGVNGDTVHLGTDEYYVLGDNSPNSEDSRFWPNGGAIRKDSFVGCPFLLHFPHRWAPWTVFGRTWQIPDWSRIGLLR